MNSKILTATTHPAEHESAVQASALAPEVREFAERRGISANLRSVMETTDRLFGNDWTLSLEHDPEVAGESYLVFRVRARGSFPEIHARDRQWHTEMIRHARPNADAFRLCIDVMNDR